MLFCICTIQSGVTNIISETNLNTSKFVSFFLTKKKTITSKKFSYNTS